MPCTSPFSKYAIRSETEFLSAPNMYREILRVHVKIIIIVIIPEMHKTGTCLHNSADAGKKGTGIPSSDHVLSITMQLMWKNR